MSNGARKQVNLTIVRKTGGQRNVLNARCVGRGVLDTGTALREECRAGKIERKARVVDWVGVVSSLFVAQSRGWERVEKPNCGGFDPVATRPFFFLPFVSCPLIDAPKYDSPLSARIIGPTKHLPVRRNRRERKRQALSP
jgi:hypothetical protein